jgi:multidrug efflux pump subunit AcrA (membrane-fusion protein)
LEAELMKPWIWIALVTLSLGLTIFGLMRPAAQQGTTVNVVRVERGEFGREVRATGVVEARLYNLTFPRPGRVTQVRVREGQTVQAGQVLAVQETAAEVSQLRSAQETLRALQARVSAQEAEFRSNQTRLQNQLAEARRNLELAQRLLEIGSASQNEVSQHRRQIADLEAQLASLSQTRASTRRDLEAQITARQTEIASLNRTIANAELRTPVAGTVASVGYLEGVESGAGAIRVIEAGSLRVQARLAEADIPLVRLDQPVMVELDAAPNQPLQARVNRLGAQAEVAVAGGSAVLPVFIAFQDAQAEAIARPGLTATVRITTLRLAEAIKVPLEALVEEQGRHSVWVVDETSRTVRKEPVTLKARSLTHAAVEGLAENSLLVSLPPENLQNGSLVSYLLPPTGERP